MKRKLAFAACFFCCGVALTAIIGHALGPDVLPKSLYGDTPMALSTASSVIALALAVVVLLSDVKSK